MKRQKKSKDKKRRIILLSVIGLIIILGGVFLFFLEYKPSSTEFVENKTFAVYSNPLFDYEVTKYVSGAEVTDVKPEKNLTIGVVVDPWNLKFGKIPAGGNFGTRFIQLRNLEKKEVRINFKVYGNISRHVNFSKNDFTLYPEESTTVEAYFYASSAEIGSYSGQIDVIVQKPKYDFLYFFWR